MVRVEALTTGQLLDRVFTLYTKNFLLFLCIAAIPQLVYLPFALLPTVLNGSVQFDPSWSRNALISTGSILLGLIFKFAALGASQGACTVAVSDLYLGQPTSIGKCYRQTLPMIFRLMGLVLGYAMLVGLGIGLLVVPGVYWAITYALATSVMAIERVSFSEAMSRSGDLVRGNRGRIALIFLLGFVLNVIIAYGLTIPTLFLTKMIVSTHPLMAAIANISVSTLAGSLSSPIGLIGFTLAYYDARIRKEAFDLEYMIQSDVPTAPAMTLPGANAANSGQ